IVKAEGAIERNGRPRADPLGELACKTDISSRKTVDRLPVVTDAEQHCAGDGIAQRFNEGCAEFTDVLKLVDQDVLVRRHVTSVTYIAQGTPQHLREVDLVSVCKGFLV